MKSGIIGLGLALVLVTCGYSLAEESANAASTEVAAHDSEKDGKSVHRFCLVCGPEEETESLSVSYKHKGKKYSFCSMDCLKVFKKDPEPYLKAIESNKEHVSQNDDK